jgi:hypothetical protein
LSVGDIGGVRIPGFQYMRPPMPRPRQVEIDTLYELLQALRLPVIERSDTAIGG